MDIKNRFQNAYEELEDAVKRRNERQVYTCLGYSSNLDVLLDFKAEKLNEMLAGYLPDEGYQDMKNAGIIQNVQDLLHTIVYFCTNGIGGEADITDPSLIFENFAYSYGMGGTAVQAAMALSKVGGHSVVHLTDDSQEVLDILDSPFIHAADPEGRLCRTRDIKGHNPQELHFILQFKKGDVIRTAGQETEIPCSNRLILTRNTVNETLPLWEPFFRWTEEHAQQVTSNVLSSFNAITDPAVLLKRLEFVKRHAQVYHQNNPDGIIYFEDAHYHNAEVRGICMDTVYPHVDIMSMNEEELQYTLEQMFLYRLDIDDIIECVQGAEFLMKRYTVRKGIVVHTKDYARFVGAPGNVDIESGLIFGAVMATAKAMFGGYGGEKEIREVLKLPLSEKGLRNREVIMNSPWKDRVKIVPTCYIDKPKYTIGLGDSFTAGVQLCF